LFSVDSSTGNSLVEVQAEVVKKGGLPEDVAAKWESSLDKGAWDMLQLIIDLNKVWQAQRREPTKR
jgi:hypothetical protein